MKINLLTAAAVGMAGLALATWARNRATGSTQGGVLGQVWGQAAEQRRQSGAAIPDNLEYMRWWDNPMASTIYGTGGLGD